MENCGFLHIEEDYTTLETCSVIFPQLAERHLYSHITFTAGDKDYIIDPTKLSLILIDRPHIANYVRSLRIFVRLQDCLSVISPILLKLSHVKSITVGVGEDRHYPPSWDSLDTRFRMAFQNCIRSPSIEQVRVLGFDHFPLNVFDDCRNIRHLQLLSRYIQVTGAVSIPHLRSLDMMVDQNSIIAWIKTNPLHSLSLQMNDHPNLTQIRALMEACSPTLVNLEIGSNLCVHSSQSTKYSTLAVFRVQLPLLERIVIRSFVIAPLERDPRPLLSSLPIFTPSLLSISVIHPVRLCVHLNFLNPLQGHDLSDIAALLVLPVFSRIELYIKAKSALLPDIVPSFKQNTELKRLHGTGKLVITQIHKE